MLTKLKAIREAIKPKMTQQALAHKAGISLRALQRAEKLQTNPTFNNAKAIARALKVKVEDLT